MTDFIDEQERLSEKKTLSEVIRRALDAYSQDFRVCLPAKIERYDFKKQLVDVTPVFKRSFSDGTTEEMPQIYNVPVAFPRAGDAFISMPLEKGHYVLLVFCDRSLDSWLSNGGKVKIDDTRKHDLSDPIAIAGCYPFNAPADVANATDIILKNKKNSTFTEMRIKKNGHIQIINEQYEFMKTLTNIMQYLSESVVYTCGGPQKLKHTQLRKEMAKLKTFTEG